MELSILFSFSCWSYVGKIGNKQQLSLATGCWSRGIVAHEIGKLYDGLEWYLFGGGRMDSEGDVFGHF